MNDFVLELSNSRHPETYLPFYPERVEGYSEAEIEQIAERCNIDIHGQFREFLLQMGRSSGGLLWGDSVFLYDPTWKGEDFKLQQQLIMKDELDEPTKGMFDAITNKFFSLTRENEGCYFSCLVTARQDDNVWAFDYGKPDYDFTDTGCTLLEYLKWLVAFETKNSRFYVEYTPTEEMLEKFTKGHLLE